MKINNNNRDSLIEQAIQYAGKMYDINLSSFGNLITKNDIINEVISMNVQSEVEMIQTVRDVVFREKRRLMASKQKKQLETSREKFCKGCEKPKLASEFYVRVDSRTGYRFLCNLCKVCERERHNKDYHRKKHKLKQELNYEAN